MTLFSVFCVCNAPSFCSYGWNLQCNLTEYCSHFPGNKAAASYDQLATCWIILALFLSCYQLALQSCFYDTSFQIFMEFIRDSNSDWKCLCFILFLALYTDNIFLNFCVECFTQKWIITEYICQLLVHTPDCFHDTDNTSPLMEGNIP